MGLYQEGILSKIPHARMTETSATIRPYLYYVISLATIYDQV
jgi:hypothetical protein